MTTIDRLRHPSISEAVTRAAGITPEPRRYTMDRPGPARRVPRRAADLMEKRARPRLKRPRPRSGRGVGCTRHPCRQASLRVSPRRGAGRPHPPAMGALSVMQWGAAPGPVACRRLGPVYQPCASPRRSRAVTGPAGPAPARDYYPGRFQLLGEVLAEGEGARRATGVPADGAAAWAGSLAPGQRWSAGRKRDVVLRLLRGESLEALSREAGVEIYRLDAWRERAMAGLELG